MMPRMMLRVLLAMLIVIAIASLWPQRSVQSPRAQEQPAAATAMETNSTDDRLAYPPDRQTFTSGAYQFVITAVDQWQTPAATGTLYRAGTRLWQRDLPHEYGPRFVLVSPTGQVLLLDEFINVASPYALTLLEAEGDAIAQYSFDDIKRTLDVSSAALTQQATSGWWISASPRLSTEGASAGQQALIQTGGTTLEVDLNTGVLTRCDP